MPLLPKSRFLVPAILLSSVALVRCASEDELEAAPAGRAGAAGSAGTAGKGSAGSAPNAGSSGKGTSGFGGAGAGGTSAGLGGSAGSGGSAGGGVGGTVPIVAGAGADEAGAGGKADAGGGGEGGASEPREPVLEAVLGGSFVPLPAYAGAAVAGSALLVRTLDGHTRVSLQATGLDASTEYPAHVHALPCEFAAGGHYKIDPANTATDEANEIWAPFTTDTAGIGRTEVIAEHPARGDAMSVVIHDPTVTDMPKMACADLDIGNIAELRASGTFASFAAAEAIDQTITGSVEFTRSAEGTGIELTLAGLDSASTYACHVHALPCAVNTAGGHYRLDPGVTDTVESNELWPALGDTSDGAVDETSTFSHRARLDAQSVVVHRSADNATPKVACADLHVENHPDLEFSGMAVLLPGATAYPNLVASATLARRLDGTTALHLEATGLAAHETYPVHVHDLPCGIQSGGAHYLRDPAAPTGETNELWAPVEAEHDGSAEIEASFEHLARADARSLVIHDYTDGTRLACIDFASTP
jgi:hypothetical protein